MRIRPEITQLRQLRQLFHRGTIRIQRTIIIIITITMAIIIRTSQDIMVGIHKIYTTWISQQRNRTVRSTITYRMSNPQIFIRTINIILIRDLTHPFPRRFCLIKQTNMQARTLIDYILYISHRISPMVLDP